MIKKIAFALLLILLGCSPTCDYSQIKVIKVIDGDTIELESGQLLRYIGIDTPEVRLKKENHFVYSPQPFALEAAEFNRKLVEGKNIEIEFDLEKKDRYGRLLGYCFIDNQMVNAKLLEEGYAVLYAFPPNVKYTEIFVSLQKKARQEKRGLWGACSIINHNDAAKYLNQVRTVEGIVVSTYKSDKCVFLNFGQNYRTDFTVAIFTNSLNSFYQKGIQPEAFYRGKRVQASGKIREYNGPEIIVNHPAEIEIINNN